MDVHQVLSNVIVFLVVLLVEDDEEQVETRHDRSTDVDVVAEGLRAVVSALHGIGCSQDGGSCIEGGMNARLGKRNSLLLHRFVDGHLVFKLHLVELINAANTMVSEH